MGNNMPGSKFPAGRDSYCKVYMPGSDTVDA